jgi:UDP-N-acetylglucosamine 2-epimerase (non-hydrolysing)
VAHRSRQRTVLTVFGTRPEAIKLAPVLRALAARAPGLRSVHVASSQHRDLLLPLAERLGVRIDHDLDVMTADQTPSRVAARVLERLDPVLDAERPDAVVVQGDTTTALAAALAGFHRRIPVAHVEAGLRTGDLASPFPEEMNRRLVSQLARWHFAATPANVAALRAEGVPASRIVLTGNPVVDSLRHILAASEPSLRVRELLDGVKPRRLLLLTTHRREAFGEVMGGHLRALRRFVERWSDTVLLFPVHPNPAVRAAAREAFRDAERVVLTEPLDYADFVHLLDRAWLTASDSGGVQEECAALGRPLLVLRDTTERREAVECGVARMVGHSGERLAELLEQARSDEAWFERARRTPSPFGAGDSGERIAAALEGFLGADAS